VYLYWGEPWRTPRHTVTASKHQTPFMSESISIVVVVVRRLTDHELSRRGAVHIIAHYYTQIPQAPVVRLDNMVYNVNAWQGNADLDGRQCRPPPLGLK